MISFLTFSSAAFIIWLYVATLVFLFIMYQAFETKFELYDFVEYIFYALIVGMIWPVIVFVFLISFTKSKKDTY